MRKKFRITIFLIAFCLLAVADTGLEAGSYAGLAQTVEQKGIFWQVQSENNTLFLLGSMHLASPKLYPLGQKIEDAFNRSEVLVVEVNINQTDYLQLEALMQEKGLFPPGDNLEAHLSAQTYQLAQERLGKMGLSIEQFSQFKPWLLALQVSLRELSRLGLNPDFGIDKHFLDRAQGNKTILELESFDYQIRLFEELSDYYQDLLLFYTIVDLDTTEREVQRLILAWKSGDVELLEQILSESVSRYPEFLPIYQKLIYQRNRTMLAEIKQFIGLAEDYFVVIGAAHLVGTQGIISLLRNSGYTVQQL